MKHSQATKLLITYEGPLDRARDAAISAALGDCPGGSGYCFATDVRDFTATVPEAELAAVLRALSTIDGVLVKQLVEDAWVVVARCEDPS